MFKCNYIRDVLHLLVTLVLLSLGIFSPVFANTDSFGRRETKDSTNSIVYFAIDDRSRSKLGEMPIPRRFYASFMLRAKKAGAKSILLKFNLDRQSDDDSALSAAMRQIPTFLQIELTSGGLQKGQSNTLANYKRKKPFQFDSNQLLHGDNFVLPTIALYKETKDLGFSEARIGKNHDKIESFAIDEAGDGIPSIQLIAAEKTVNKVATIVGSNLVLDGHSFQLDSGGSIMCPYLRFPPPKVHSILELLDGDIAPASLQNKLVVLGYLRSDSPTISVSDTEKIKVHDYFFRQVNCLLQQISKSKN